MGKIPDIAVGYVIVLTNVSPYGHNHVELKWNKPPKIKLSLSLLVHLKTFFFNIVKVTFLYFNLKLNSHFRFITK